MPNSEHILHLQLSFRLQIRRASYLKAQVELASVTSRLKVSYILDDGQGKKGGRGEIELNAILRALYC